MYNIITQIETNYPDCKIFKYTIRFNNERPDGDACIFIQLFKTLKHPMSGINEPQIRRWKKRGLNNNDFFACLDDFYPHGRYFKERELYFRKGTGEKILSNLISKIRIFNPKIIYAVPTNKIIKQFLISQEWQSDYQNNKLLYKII